MISAHAQKKIGPAVVIVVVLRDDFLPEEFPWFY